MTGYASLRQPTSAGELTVSLRSVNHRGLDLHFHLAGELAQFENAMRSLLKQHVARGHVEIRVSLSRDTEQECFLYNRTLLTRYVSVFQQAATDFSLDSKPDLNSLFSLPGVFDSSQLNKPLENTFEPEAIGALKECIQALNAYREQEARELCAGLETEIDAIDEQSARISAIRIEALPQLCARLRDRLSELLANSAISESRLAEEAALLADRSDIQEELTRLVVHAQELRRIFENGGEIGKRLDFLLQEMNRETNTILSKTSGVGEAGLTITSLALGIKANIERIREQALNLE